MKPFAIAGIQMHVAALNSNVEAMRHRIDIVMARFPWTQMVLFSELAPYGPLDQFAQPFPNEVLKQFQEDARRYGIWLIPGSMFEKKPDGRIFNTSVVINPQGEIVTKYSKMFPFRPYEAGISAGTEFCIFDVPDVGRFGLSICYDIWFPETTRQLTSQGVEVLLNPVLTGTTDRDAELAIARATAAQFQCYVFAVNGLAAGGVAAPAGGTVDVQTDGAQQLGGSGCRGHTQRVTQLAAFLRDEGVPSGIGGSLPRQKNGLGRPAGPESPSCRSRPGTSSVPQVPETAR